MMYPQEDFVVDDANAGRRLDSLVRKLCDDVPLGTLMKWLRKGRVRLNNRRALPKVRVALGDVIGLPNAVQLFGDTVQDDAAPKAPKVKRLPKLDVVFEDAHLLIVDKPALLAAHPGTNQGDDSLSARISQHLDAESAPVGRRPGLAQRLDRGVSGLVPVGKDARVLRLLAEQGTAHIMDKTYLALVDGCMQHDEGTIDAPLFVGDEPMGDRPRVVVSKDGKPAVTLYQVLSRCKDCTLVALRLRTGRTHQIRAHMLHLGHGLLGDPRYGDLYRNRYLFETLGLKRPFLHAAHLTLQHPISGEVRRFKAELSKDLQRVLASVMGERGKAMPRQVRDAWLRYPLDPALAPGES